MSSGRLPELTTTSYAILGLLAIQPWSTYELAKHMQRDLKFVWPRAESNLYAEPKKLIAHGFASASSEPRGRRRRTVYSITPAGREALAAWIGLPAAASRRPPGLRPPRLSAAWMGQAHSPGARPRRASTSSGSAQTCL